MFKIIESTSKRVNFLKRKLANAQGICQELGPEEQESILE